MSHQRVDFDVTVSTPSFRAAVQAVTPHAGQDPDWTRLYRVRAYVLSGELVLVATDGSSAALATVEVEDQGDALGVFDLLPADAREIARIFKPSKDEAAWARLQFEVTEKALTVADVSGMFGGKSLTLPATPIDDQFPNSLAVLQRVRAGAVSFSSSDATGMSPHYLAKFVQAGLAYGELLVVRQTGKLGALIVSCGPWFVGMVSTARFDEGAADVALREWSRRETTFTESHPVPPADPNASQGKPSFLRDASGVFLTPADIDAWMAGMDGEAPPEKKRGRRKAKADDESDGGDS